MIGKYANKKKFVNRGVYAIDTEDDNGTLVVNIKKYNSISHKKMMIMQPEMSHDKKTDQSEVKVSILFIDMPNKDVKDIFDAGEFEYIGKMPKVEYQRYLDLYKQQENS